MIVTANHWFNTPPLWITDWDTWKRVQVIPMMLRFGIQINPTQGSWSAATLEVRQGNWLAICACGGAEYGWEEGWMMCMSCWNNAYDHQLRRTEFPPERHAIEALLEPRLLLNRNWLHGETLEVLRQENAEHGIGVRI